MTSLIDVIFLLLLFFMLSSTFSRFAEVEIAAAAAGSGAAADAKPYFLRLGQNGLSLNGRDRPLDTLAEALTQEGESTRPVLVSLQDGVTAQRLTDLLVALRGVEGISVTVLGAT